MHWMPAGYFNPKAEIIKEITKYLLIEDEKMI